MTMYGPVDRSPRRRYYAAQYTLVWSLDAARMRTLLDSGARDVEYDLSELGTTLGRRYTFDRGVPKRFWGQYLIRPLDWTTHQYLAAREEFDDARDGVPTRTAVMFALQQQRDWRQGDRVARVRLQLAGVWHTRTGVYRHGTLYRVASLDARDKLALEEPSKEIRHKEA